MFCYPGFNLCVYFSKQIGLDHPDPETHFFRFPNLECECFTEPLKGHDDGENNAMSMFCIYVNNYL